MDIPTFPNIADSNRKRFIGFRVLFNSRFYYPVLAVLFLDLGLSATQYTLLNFVWAIAIVVAEVPSGALADRIGRRPLIIASAICMVLEMSCLLVRITSYNVCYTKLLRVCIMRCFFIK